MPPDASDVPDGALPLTRRRYGGLRRLQFVCIMVGVSLVQHIVLGASPDMTDRSTGIVLGLTGIASLIAVSNRLKNMRISGWWILLLFALLLVFVLGAALDLSVVRYLALVVLMMVGIGLVACPEGYGDTRKLDRAGAIVLYIFGGVFIVSFIVAAFGWIFGN